MTLCVCGKPAETFGGMCDRCASLQMLGLGMHANSDEIENAYLTLVKVWHPDRFAHDANLRLAAEDKLKEINGAHEFLVSSPPKHDEFPRSAPKPAPEVIRNEPPQVPSAIFHREREEDLEGEETDEVRRILRRQRQHKSTAPAILMKVGFALGAIALIALVLLTGDSFLSSNQHTARAWEELKAELGHDVRTKLPENTEKAQQPQGETAPTPPAAPAPSTSTPPSPPAPQKTTQHFKGAEHVRGAQPYVTSGLTPMEVLSVLGNPISSTGEKMVYKGGEIDFKNGQVAGWKIDPALIRVKLWPDTQPVPGLSTFGVGSSKSDVISVQGTPTLFSDNEFGYGNSLVFFQNGRVVRWQQDPASVRLRVAH